MIRNEEEDNKEENLSKENLLLINNKSLISKDVNSEINTNRRHIEHIK